MENLMLYAEMFFTYFGAAVALATSIVIALEKFAQVTPSTKDDEYVAKFKVWLGYASALLDNLSVFTTKDKK